MNHPVCIYLDQRAATKAAALARRNGASARIKVETLSEGNKEDTIYIIESEQSQKQKVIDSIADGARSRPELSEEAVHCPNCDSIKVEFPEHPQVSPTMRGFGKMIDFFGSVIGLRKDGKFHCTKCGEIWDPESTAALSEKDDAADQRKVA